ncbi:MAG: gliding motility-associated C-terminal domain-containing protein [Bacteroidales bacterium]|nr:gliding motility-associated C-terminal domain-containing protein [Bacteroidales bacterium]
MAKKFFVIFLLSTICNICSAQLETSVWYFGRNCGLDFKSQNPTILTDGALDNWEGVACFSDSLGHLLFYTDGQTIWNREHNVMANGDGLIGSHGSTESAIIVPWPKSNGKYYVFVVDENGLGPLSYSVVDMSLDDGKGAVTSEKNVILEDLVVEKVTAIRHSNQQDFWVLTRVTGHDNDEIQTPNTSGTDVVEYLIDENGLNLASRQVYPVGYVDYSIANFKNVSSQPFAVGYMRVSPNGQYIACATSINLVFPDGIYSIIDLYKFDPSTGVVSPYAVIRDYDNQLYGVEFSNDESKLYYSSERDIFQVDLSLSTVSEIEESAIKVGTFDYESFGIPLFPPDLYREDFATDEEYKLAIEQQTPFAGALQLAINGKIYVSQNNCEYLGVIENPRERGGACGFNTRGQYLGGKIGQMGLPNFIPTYFLPPNFTISDNCVNKNVHFECNDERPIDYFEWVLADSVGTTIATGNNREFDYALSKSGTYRITLTIRIGANESSEYRFFKVYDPPSISLPEDQTICKGEVYTIVPDIPANCDYVWSNGCTEMINPINESTVVSIGITNQYTGCYNSDDIQISVVDPTEFSFGEPREFCQGDSVEVNCPLSFAYNEFVYLDNSSSALSRYFKQAGVYTAQLTDMNGCKFTNSIQITANSLPVIDFKTDQVLCRDSFKIIDCNVKNATYKWSTGETTQSVKVSEIGFYSVSVTDAKGCASKDSIELEEFTKPEFSLIADTTICDDTEFYLTSEWPDATDYIWQNGQHGKEILVESSGIYKLSIINMCGVATDSVDITVRYCGDFVFPNIITPNGDGINDYFKIKGLEWSSGWEMSIFNREGRMVFHSSDYKNNWNAPDLSDGVYFYIMEKQGKRYKGNISVFHK